MFMESEPIPPRRAEYPGDHLGRIPATSVTPPHTVNSLKRCITEAEGIINVPRCDLYADLNSESRMNQGPISIIAADSLGSTPETAIALVYSISPQESTSTPRVAVNPKFTKKIAAIQDCNNAAVNRKFLNFKKDEVFHTDGIPRREIFAGGGGGRSSAHPFKVYEAVNSAGLKGFVMKNAVRFIPEPNGL